MSPTYDYGKYAELTQDPNFEKIFKQLNKVSKKLKVDYFVIGGLAVYTYSKNPPEDWPDIDLLLNTTAKHGKIFVTELLKKEGFELIHMALNSSLDMFSTLSYSGIQIDIFTSQEASQYLKAPIIKQGLKLEPPEELIVEKLIRESYEDNLMIIDLLLSGIVDMNKLDDLASEHMATGKLHSLIRLAGDYKQGEISLSELKRKLKGE